MIFASEAGSEREELLIHHFAPKTRRRAAKHQYSTILCLDTVQFLWRSFGDAAPRDVMWPYPGTLFKKCLDQIFGALGIPAGMFTAAGLRGGGAFAEFRAVGDIPTIAWRLRVKSTDTLGHYLQEASAALTLRDLQTAVREKIDVAAHMFPFLLAT